MRLFMESKKHRIKITSVQFQKELIQICFATIYSHNEAINTKTFIVDENIKSHQLQILNLRMDKLYCPNLMDLEKTLIT